MIGMGFLLPPLAAVFIVVCGIGVLCSIGNPDKMKDALKCLILYLVPVLTYSIVSLIVLLSIGVI